MSVTLGKEFQRNTKSGIQGNRKTAQIPTGPSQTVGVANDPGVAGGPSSIPRGAFGPEGSVESGRQIQAGANMIITDEVRNAKQLELEHQRAIAQREEIEMTLRVAEAKKVLEGFAGGVNVRDFSGEGLSPLDNYRLKSQQHIDKLINKAGTENFTSAFKQEYERRLDSAQTIQNAAVVSTLDDIRKTEFEDIVQGDYTNAAINNRNDVAGWLANNKLIYEERFNMLGQKKANEFKKAADTEAVMSTYKRFMEIGNLDRAEEALEDEGVRLVAGRAAISEAFNAINKARIQKGIDRGIADKTKADPSKNFITLDNGSLWDVRLNDGKGGIVPGSENPAKGVIITNSGAMQFKKGKEGEPSQWEFIYKDKTKQSEQEKRDDIIKSLKVHGVLLTPDVVLRIHGLEPKDKNEFAQKVALLERTIPDEEVLNSTLQGLALGLEQSDQDKSVALIKEMNLPEDVERRALLAIATDKADLRSPKDVTADIIKKGADTGRANVAQKQAEAQGGLGTFTGQIEGQEDIGKAETLTAAAFAEPMKIDSTVTNSIVNTAENYVTLLQKNGNIRFVDGGAELLGQMTKDAEQFLQDGTSNTIGHAVWMAFNNLSDEQRNDMKRITGLQQVNEMLGIAEKEPVEGDINTLNADVQTVENTNEKALRDIASLESQEIEGLDITDATGVFSALRSFIGSTIGQVFPNAENKEVTKSRLMLSLIARDVVRMISLSPRFAVKEQELIQSIFAGPELFNSPRQALNRITTMQEVIDKKINNIKGALKRQPDFDKESELVEEASQLLEIKERMNMFTFDLMPIKDVQTPKAVRDLGPEKAQKFYNSLSSTEKRELPRKVKEAIFIQKRNADAGINPRRRKKPNTDKK